MNSKIVISDLVDRFHRNKDTYKNPKYNETQLRREFLDPFFSALGWDVENKQGFAEQYKEVVHEDAIKVSGATKAPDYSFRIGGVRKFFVEAKKPAVDIKYDIHPSYQLRRYAWSAKLPISILTDFEEFSVYDCRIKPNQNDSASVARIYYQTYDNYLKDLDFIYNTFSKDAILKGSFGRYISSTVKKKGTSEVDKEFLKEIEKWRETLARNIAIRNKGLSIYELNFVVQLTIDRIIFLRIAEDRGVEEYRSLYNHSAQKDIYKNLFRLFKIADDKYNSGIFDFQKDKISPNITIDDKVLKPILLHLYYPESPYEFSVLPADILGNIYEQFLGKTIRLTPSHYAKVEEKPEVRKAGGVYYTPKYIVDYIVKNTVGEVIKGKTPRQISKITICDPACGSGSFLIQAYQYLLDYHLEYYQKDPKKYKNNIIQIGENTFQLTTKEKKRILLNNIYGVDIDPQAVEVTKLSLLLKVLEGENRETLNQQLKLFNERALPNLSNNIKCGNSLIGTDFYDNVDITLFGENEMRKINAFDWEKEFPDIFHRKVAKNAKEENKNKELCNLNVSAVECGFDVVIGNPPYVFARGEGFTTQEKEYFYHKYLLSQYQLNTYIIFTERSFNILNNTGKFGFIIPNNWLTIDTNSDFRKFLLEKGFNIKIMNIYDKVFQDANVDSSILIFSKVGNNIIHFFELKNGETYFTKKIPTDNFLKTKSCIINYDIIKSEGIIEICEKISYKKLKLNEIYLVKAGIKAYEVGKGIPKQNKKIRDERAYHNFEKLDESYYRYLDGKDVKRYYLGWSKKYIKYGKNLAAPRKFKLFQGERILVRQIPSKLPYSILASYVDEIIINDLNSMIIKKLNNNYNLKYLLGILNSKVMSFWFFYSFAKLQRKTFPQFKIKELSIFPIPPIDFSNPSEEQLHDTLVSLVNEMLLTQKQFHSAKMERDRKIYKQKIDMLDRKIDKLVYELYGLSDEEIKIIERGSNG